MKIISELQAKYATQEQEKRQCDEEYAKKVSFLQKAIIEYELLIAQLKKEREEFENQYIVLTNTIKLNQQKFDNQINELQLLL